MAKKIHEGPFILSSPIEPSVIIIETIKTKVIYTIRPKADFTK